MAKINYNKAKFTASYALPEQVPPRKLPEISFVGRSNVGKSSLMNKIFNRKNLVKVSQRPGLTQHINFFNVGDVDFVDLPGYGFAKVSKADKDRWKVLVSGYFTQDRNYALCVVLVDIRHDVSDLDKQMIAFLQDNDIPFMIAFTKADKLSSKSAVNRQVQKLCKQLSDAGDVVILAVSSLKGTGVEDLRTLIDEAVEQAR